MDLDAFAERAAIAEHDGGLSREAAERLAAEAQGFADPAALHAAAVERWRLALDALALRETSHRGREHVAHARAFVAGGWAAQAAALGWSEPELFGLCPVAPWARLDRMGVAWLRADVAGGDGRVHCVRLRPAPLAGFPRGRGAAAMVRLCAPVREFSDAIRARARASRALSRVFRSGNARASWGDTWTA